MRVSGMGRRRSESISSSSSSSFSSSNATSLPLHQAKSLDSLDRDQSADAGRHLFPSWKRRDYQKLNERQSTSSSCESGDSSSCCWSGDGQSSSSSSAMSVRPRHSQKHHQYHQLQSHPKSQQRTGNDCKMLAIFTCCLDRRRQPSSNSSSSRWTETPEYEKRTATCSSASMSWESSSDSLNEMGHHESHDTVTGPLITKVPNQRYTDVKQ